MVEEETKPKVVLEDPEVKERAWMVIRLISRCRKAARDAKWTKERWVMILDDMTSGDNDHLMRVVNYHFDVKVNNH